MERAIHIGENMKERQDIYYDRIGIKVIQDRVLMLNRTAPIFCPMRLNNFPNSQTKGPFDRQLSLQEVLLNYKYLQV